jgi:CDP-paratose 2-epimerase
MASGNSILILGAGYMGAALAEVALEQDKAVTLADNWYLTERSQLEELEREGARVETADVRSAEDLDRLLSENPDRVYLLAAQASRPVAAAEPDYTEETNVTGARRVAEALGRAGGDAALVYASSLNVYGPSASGTVTTDHPYGPQRDLAHLSKVYAELCLRMYAEGGAFDLSILRFGIVFGPSPAAHEGPDHQTVVDKFCRLAAAGEELPLDDGGSATIGAVHVEDAACIMLAEPRAAGVSVANVAAESVTVADVAALAGGEKASGSPACIYETPFDYRFKLADYMSRV